MGNLEHLTALTRELKLPESTGENLAMQLAGFVESQKGRWEMRRSWRYPYRELGGHWKEKLPTEFVTPTDLNGAGVNKSFLVVWNYPHPGISGDVITPMEIWIARGVGVGKIGAFKALFVTYLDVGKLKHGEPEIQFSGEGPFHGRIYLNSPVIMKPQQKVS